MSDDVATDWFFGVGVEHGGRATVNLSDDLIRNHHSDTKFVSKALQSAHEFGKMSLPVAELSTAKEVGSIESSSGIDNEQGKAGLAHHGCCLVEELQLMVRIVGTRVSNIVEDLFAGETITVGNREQTDRTKGTLGVDIQTLAFAAAHIERQLASHSEGVANLRLSSSKFAKELSDTAGFDATREEGIEVLGAGSNGYQFGTALVDFGSGSEAHRHELGCCRVDSVRVVRGFNVGHDKTMEIIPSSRILLALAEDIPLICSRLRWGV